MPEIHDFDDQDLSDYDGDVQGVDFVTAPITQGSHALRFKGGEQFEKDIVTTVAGKTFSKGNTARVWIRFASEDSRGGFLFGVQDIDNHYVAQVDPENQGIRLFELVNGSIPDGGLNESAFDFGVEGSGDSEWFELVITWDDGTLGGSDNDITFEAYDLDGNQVGSTLTGNNSTYASENGTGYRAVAITNTGEHVYFDDAQTDGAEDPAPPTNLAVSSVGTDTVDLEWTDESTTEDEFKVYRSTSSPVSTSDTLAGTVNTSDESGTGGTETFQDTGRSQSTTHFYAVTANDTDASLESSLSNEVEATTGDTPPSAPSIDSVSKTNNTQLAVQWTDNATNEDGYRVRARPTGTSNWTYTSADLAANTTSHTTDSLNQGEQYDIQVSAFNTGGSASDILSPAATTDLQDVTSLTLRARSGALFAKMGFEFP